MPKYITKEIKISSNESDEEDSEKKDSDEENSHEENHC